MSCIEAFRAFRQTNICVEAENLWLRISVLLDRLDPSFYFGVRTRAMVCIYASAYVGGLGSGTPEYTCWNVKCVFWAARERGMSPKLTVTTFKCHDRRARVMSDSRWRVRARTRVRLWGLLVTITCLHVNRHTDPLSPPQYRSNVCVLFQPEKGKSHLYSSQWAFHSFFVEVVFGQPLAGAYWCSTQICSLFVKLDLI